MREQLKIEFARPEHATELSEWLKKTKGNLFDPSILSYPTLRVLRSHGIDGAAAYLPMQNVLMLESLAVREGLEAMTAAQAFRDLVKGSQVVASGDKMREIYFLCEDRRVVEMGIHHGFEEIKWPVLRLRL